MATLLKHAMGIWTSLTWLCWLFRLEPISGFELLKLMFHTLKKWPKVTQK